MINLILFMKFGCLFNKFVCLFVVFFFFGVVYCILESIQFFLLAFDIANAKTTQ